MDHRQAASRGTGVYAFDQSIQPAPPPRPKLLYLVTEDWYFWSHRLPMARAARDAGFEVAVATRVAGHGEAIEGEGFRLFPLAWRRGDRGAAANLAAVAEITLLYRREQPDIVHHVALKPVVLGSAAARLAHRPAMVNALTGLGHAFVAHSAKANAVRLALIAAMRTLVDRPRSAVVFQNPDDLALLVDKGVVRRNRTRLVRGSGIDARHFAPLPEPAPEEPLVCALVARMLISKGVPVAVEAVRIARRRGAAITLLLAGEPDPANPDSIPAAVLEAWAREPGVVRLGHVADVRGVWAQAHVAVLPSAREGFPKSLLEAAACGRPIVASDVPGCREITLPGVNGELVPPGDPARLAEALIRLARDPDRRRRYGIASRRLVETDLCDTSVGRAMVALYQELLADRWSP